MSLARWWIALVSPLFLVQCTAREKEQVQAEAADLRLETKAGDCRAHAWLEIDRRAFEANLRVLKTRLGTRTKICAVMKADAYGHGIDLLAPSVVALDVPCVGITSNEEAGKLREKGFRKELIRIRTATLGEIEDGLRYDLEETFGNLTQARLASQIAGRHGRRISFHLSLNSAGMSRNGLDLGAERGKSDATEILKLPNLQIVGIMTHFPVEDRNDVLRGLAVFKEEADWVIRNGNLDRGKIALHCANSFATLEVPESHLDMVRPGGALYGDTLPKYVEYQRVLQFKSRVASVNSYPAGKTVSYDRTYSLRRDSRLANIPVGYSDGYRRAFSNAMHVLIRGQRFPVVGKVTMNTFMADVTDNPEIRSGDEVVLFGKQGASEITQAELEESAGTLLAELYTIWGKNNPRILKSE